MSPHYVRCDSGDAELRATARRRGSQERFHRASRRWFVTSRDRGIPDGFRAVPATVYTDGRRVVVTAHPDDVWPGHEEADGEHPHNCDAMGCGWEHVIARGILELCAAQVGDRAKGVE